VARVDGLLILSDPAKKKSRIDKSGERGGHGMYPKREMRRSGNFSRRTPPHWGAKQSAPRRQLKPHVISFTTSHPSSHRSDLPTWSVNSFENVRLFWRTLYLHALIFIFFPSCDQSRWVAFAAIRRSASCGNVTCRPYGQCTSRVRSRKRSLGLAKPG